MHPPRIPPNQQPTNNLPNHIGPNLPSPHQLYVIALTMIRLISCVHRWLIEIHILPSTTLSLCSIAHQLYYSSLTPVRPLPPTPTPNPLPHPLTFCRGPELNDCLSRTYLPSCTAPSFMWNDVHCPGEGSGDVKYRSLFVRSISLCNYWRDHISFVFIFTCVVLLYNVRFINWCFMQTESAPMTGLMIGELKRNIYCQKPKNWCIFNFFIINIYHPTSYWKYLFWICKALYIYFQFISVLPAFLFFSLFLLNLWENVY